MRSGAATTSSGPGPKENRSPSWPRPSKTVDTAMSGRSNWPRFPSRALLPPRAIGDRPEEVGGDPRPKRPVRDEEPYSAKDAAARAFVPVVGPLDALEVSV